MTEALRQGVVLIPPIGLYGNVLRLAPALTMTAEQAQCGLQILFDVVKRIPSHLMKED